MQKDDYLKKAKEGLPPWMKGRECPKKDKYLSGERILPKGISGKESLSDLVGNAFVAFNGARLKEGCRLFVEKMLADDATVGMSLAGALTPAGLGCSAIVPLIKAGFVDWIVSTGANMYHDLHFAFNCPVHQGRPVVDDKDLRENDIVRIYDVFLGYTDCLITTDEICRDIMRQKEFQKEMGTAEFYYLLGKYAVEWEDKMKLKDVSILAAAYRAGIPIYTSAPGDSTLGMDMAALEIQGNKLKINPSIDVNETAAIVLGSKKNGGKSGVVLIGGGSPKNFVLQTEPQIQEILRIKDVGHEYFLQVTDARVDTGGLSGATPKEAVSWGKVDPRYLPDAVVCYIDATVALPLITHYALAKHKPRKPKGLYHKRGELMVNLKREFLAHNKPAE